MLNLERRLRGRSQAQIEVDRVRAEIHARSTSTEDGLPTGFAIVVIVFGFLVVILGIVTVIFR